MEAPLLPIWPKELDLCAHNHQIHPMKCEDNYINDYGNWRLVAAAIQVYTDSTRNQDTSLGVDIKICHKHRTDKFQGGYGGNQDEHTVQVRKIHRKLWTNCVHSSKLHKGNGNQRQEDNEYLHQHLRKSKSGIRI